jgi:hypothetical protein
MLIYVFWILLSFVSYKLCFLSLYIYVKVSLWELLVFNTGYYQDLYNTFMTGWVCLQKMELMEILWRQLKANAFYAKKRDIIRSG